MAFPTSFAESNGFLASAPGDEELVGPLSIWRGVAVPVEDNAAGTGLITVISCWKLTAEELAEVNRTGRIWLGICGDTMPPAWVSGSKPFTDAPPESNFNDPSLN